MNTATETATAESCKYWAFISYSQTDSKWAVWLHKTLETYRVPHALRGRNGADGPIPARLFPIFRDNDELPSAADLGAAIRRALAQSRYLIVICSPRAAASQWVNEEILSFCALGRRQRILCFIVEGEPNAKTELGQLECLPPAVRRGRTAHAASVASEVEPLAADARKGRDPPRKALIRLVAGILGVDFDTLWRREKRRKRRQLIRNAAASLAILAASGLSYAAVADIGVALPGGETVRDLLDRHDASVFRPVRTANEVSAAAARAREALIARLRREWIEQAWVYNNPNRTRGPKTIISPWVSSQAMCAVFRNLGARIETPPEFWEALEAPFANNLPIEADNKKFGWFVGDADYPRAEPALWTVAALAVALRRHDVTEERRRHLLARLEYAQTVADLYRPIEDGGWNVLPQQRDPAQHTTFATVLALLAMLELRSADIGWHGDRAHIDAMLRGAVNWLAGEFDANAAQPGWRLHLNDTGSANTGEVADGLTLQIYSELLRAEEEANIAVPPQILRAIPRHIDRLVGRPIDYASALGVIARNFTNFDGAPLTRTVTESYLWHPWAIESAVRWLRRLERTGGSAEEKTRVRRVLGYIVVDIGAAGFTSAVEKSPTFVASETLYALATLLAANGYQRVETQK